MPTETISGIRMPSRTTPTPKRSARQPLVNCSYRLLRRRLLVGTADTEEGQKDHHRNQEGKISPAAAPGSHGGVHGDQPPRKARPPRGAHRTKAQAGGPSSRRGCPVIAAHGEAAVCHYSECTARSAHRSGLPARVRATEEERASRAPPKRRSRVVRATPLEIHDVCSLRIILQSLIGLFVCMTRSPPFRNKTTSQLMNMPETSSKYERNQIETASEYPGIK